MDNELKHFGRLGMRWGRRSSTNSLSSIRTKKMSEVKKNKKGMSIGKKLLIAGLVSVATLKIATLVAGPYLVTKAMDAAGFNFTAKFEKEWIKP